MSTSLPSHARYSQPSTTSYIEKLSDWDSPTDPLAPLTSEQKDSYLELASIAGSRPLPIELPLDEPVNIRHKISSKQVHPSGSIEDVLSQGFAELGMANEKIQDVQQFYNWFNKVEEKMSELEAEGYTKHVDILKTYKGHCSKIIADIDQALSSLKELEHEYVFVSTKTNALHDACEQLLADQTKLMNTAESIEHDLEFFNELDRITTKLHSPSLAVTGESFQALLTRIDECIKFMETHSTYKDSLDYLTKFKVCLSNALTMIKDYIVKSLNETTKSILNRKVSVLPTSQRDQSLLGGGSETNIVPVQEDAFTLYYGKFRTNAPRILGLVEQIEKRIERNAEYGNYLFEIHQCYFRQREQLVGPSVTTAMSDLLAANKQDQCALVRSGCSFMVHVCEDEHQLYGHFFTTRSSKLDEMLRQLCVNLYDMLRPLIIHVYHLETLAELCTILKTEMIDDHVQNNPEQLQAFEYVVKQMLEDVQERLVFRANIHIRDDILGYKPAPGDLAYPEKLQMMEDIAKSLKEAASKQASERSFIEIKLDDEQEQAESSKLLNTSSEAQNMENSIRSGLQQNQQQRFQTSPADMHGMWFPTVRRVLVCLSKLYRCIDKTIFQGLSQEALQACVQSLVRASNFIRTQEFALQSAKGAASKSVKPKVVDSQLFLIKHLLILREQIAPFHAEFAIRETQLDFSRTKDVAYQMFEFSTIPKLLRVNSNNALLQFFSDGAPEVKEFYIDSKKDVDRQLKYVCEEFIEHVTKVLIGVLDDYLSKAKLVLNVSREEGGPKTSLRHQTFATPEHLKEVVSSAYRDLKLKAKSIHGSLSLYLANRDTENILFKPIKLNVQQAYQQLDMILLENYTDEDRAIIAAPSPDQMGIASLLTITEPGAEDNKVLVCYATVGLIAMPTMISSLIMAAIAMDRYIWVRNPFRDKSSDNKKLAVILTAIWIISILVGFAPLMGWRNEEATFPYGRCIFLIVVAPSYILFVFFGFFLPTVSVTAYLHIVMCKVSKEQGQKIAACEVQIRFKNRLRNLKNENVIEEKSSSVAYKDTKDDEIDVSITRPRNYSIFSVSQPPPRSQSEGGDPLPAIRRMEANDAVVFSQSIPTPSISSEHCDDSQNPQLPKFLNNLKPMKWSRTVILILGLFVCMWMPFWLACVVQAICTDNCHLENLVSTYLVIPGIANSAVNPLVYISTDKRLKKHFCQCFFESANSETSSVSFSSHSSHEA
uniref:conserved oligomeric Golgi complex subunit 3-like isoform X2 n=1 Tax=Styela clava TaxID=7725 RepID=UPI001939E694|nr:conserved oligomeric Golgi complex subunit 3-like isoform X2 [Styela clava]